MAIWVIWLVASTFCMLERSEIRDREPQASPQVNRARYCEYASRGIGGIDGFQQILYTLRLSECCPFFFMPSATLHVAPPASNVNFFQGCWLTTDVVNRRPFRTI